MEAAQQAKKRMKNLASAREYVIFALFGFFSYFNLETFAGFQRPRTRQDEWKILGHLDAVKVLQSQVEFIPERIRSLA